MNAPAKLPKTPVFIHHDPYECSLHRPTLDPDRGMLYDFRDNCEQCQHSLNFRRNVLIQIHHDMVIHLEELERWAI